MSPTMIVLAGPSGAGQSTLYETHVAPRLAGPFINAIRIQLDELSDPSPAASYKAARLATAHGADVLARGRDFLSVTVFSHPSTLGLVGEARAKGFTVVMHVGVSSPDVSVTRENLGSKNLTLMRLVLAQAFACGQPAPISAQISQNFFGGAVPCNR